jgi:general stress protein 26
MHVAKMEDDATFWFFTDEYSGKTATLETDNPVTLTFADPVNQTYLSITGRAYLVNDEVKMTEMWNPVLKNWFPGGTATEHLTMIKIVPETAEFWEESRSAWQQVFYAGKAMFTGEKYTRGSHERVSFQES